jgi:hypothetical protein
MTGLQLVLMNFNYSLMQKDRLLLPIKRLAKYREPSQPTSSQKKVQQLA